MSLGPEHWGQRGRWSCLTSSLPSEHKGDITWPELESYFTQLLAPINPWPQQTQIWNNPTSGRSALILRTPKSFKVGHCVQHEQPWWSPLLAPACLSPSGKFLQQERICRPVNTLFKSFWHRLPSTYRNVGPSSNPTQKPKMPICYYYNTVLNF